MLKGKEKQSEEAKQGSEPDSDMIQMLELSYRELKKNMTNMLRALMENMDDVQGMKGNISKSDYTHSHFLQDTH